MSKRKNIHLIAGGGGHKPESMIPAFRRVLNESGNKEPRIAYIGAANGDHPGFFNFMKDALLKAGSCSVSHIMLCGEGIDVTAVKASLSEADIVFISGGDVFEGMACLSRYNLSPFLKGLYKGGTMFFGISAGSIMLGTHWVHWPDPDNDSSAVLFDCIGIAPLVCDTHAEEEGWEELKYAVALMKENGAGYGIPSGGTIVAGPDGDLTALKKPAVFFTMTGGRVIKGGELAVKK